MASSYSTNLRLELPVDGELSGSWGARINAGITEMVEDALSAETSITTTGDPTPVTLTENNGAADTSRNAFLDIDGALVANVAIAIPDLNKVYLVRNATTNAFTVTIKPSGTGALITQGSTALVYCDGTNCFIIAGDIGATTQAWDAQLDDIAALAVTDGNVIVGDGTNWVAESGATARTSLGAIATVVEDTSPQLGAALDTNSFAINESEGTLVASAATTDIWATDGNTLHISGTTTITSLGTAPNAGAWRKIIFDAALILTDGANLNLPGNANITTAANDFAYVYADTTTLFRVQYFKADGTATVVSLNAVSTQVFLADGTYTKPAGLLFATVELVGGGGGGGTAGVGTGDGGGGAGGYSRRTLAASAIGTETVTVGAGGAANGSSGGTTSFGSLLQATGGAGTSTAIPGNAGAGSGGDINLHGGNGHAGSDSNDRGGSGGGSYFCGGGRAGSDTLAGGAGEVNTGAGGGGGGNAAGGAGGSGIIIVTEFTT